MKTLQGKRVLITGAASGIGKATVFALKKAGARLFLADINADGLQALLSELNVPSDQATSQVCDVRKLDQLESLVREVGERFGGLDALINNAGVVHYGPTEVMAAADMDRLIQINLVAPMHLTRLCLPLLLEQPEASIVNVASMYGLFATRKAAAYHATKFGLVGFSESLRAEYGRLGLGITTVCPGFVTTDLFKSGTTSQQDKDVPVPPAYLSTTPEKIAAKIVSSIYWQKRLVLATPLAYAMYYFKRFFPGLLDAFQHLGRSRAIKKRAEARKQSK